MRKEKIPDPHADDFEPISTEQVWVLKNWVIFWWYLFVC